MHKLLLIVASLALLTGCTTPGAPPPEPTAFSSAPATHAEFLGQLFAKAGYTHMSLDPNVWERGTIRVTLANEEFGTDVTAVFTRPEGRVSCKVQALKDAFVGAIDNLDEKSHEKLLKTPYCQPV